MADTLILYSNPWSRGRIVRWMLEEIGQPYRYELLQYGPDMKSAAYRALNPMGKVPTLVHGNTIVTECAAICAYLADAFPEAGLAPAPHSPLRGAYYRWLFFGAGPVEAASTNHSLGVVVADEMRGRTGYGSIEAVADTLESVISTHTYLVGNTFSAADIYLGSQLMWTTQFGMMPMRPSFGPYMERLNERPAHKRASALDDALVPPKDAAAG